MWFTAGMIGLAIFGLVACPPEYRPINGHLRTMTISLFAGMLVYAVGYALAVAAGVWFPGRL